MIHTAGNRRTIWKLPEYSMAHIHSALKMLHEEMEVLSHGET